MSKLNLMRFNISSKRIFIDINTGKIRERIIHNDVPSFDGFLNKKGRDSKSIIQSDAGLNTQLTYLNVRKIRSDSFARLKDKVESRSFLPFFILSIVILIFTFIFNHNFFKYQKFFNNIQNLNAGDNYGYHSKIPRVA